MFQWSRYKKVFQSYWDFKRIYVFRRLSPFLDYFSLSWPLFRGGRTAARVFPNHFLINVHPPSHLLPPQIISVLFFFLAYPLPGFLLFIRLLDRPVAVPRLLIDLLDVIRMPYSTVHTPPSLRNLKRPTDAS